MELNFEKWHGCLNDFILIWTEADDVAIRSLQRQAIKLCSRQGGGIGADGIILLHLKSSRDLESNQVTIINSDGSLAATCGNGLRCAAASTLNRIRNLSSGSEIPEGIVLNLGNHPVPCRFLGRGKLKSAQNPYVAVTMGIPDKEKGNHLQNLAVNAVKDAESSHQLKGYSSKVQSFNIQNNHIVIHSDLASRDALLKLGPTLQKSAHWDGINVHLVRNKDLSDTDLSNSKQILDSPIAELYEAFVWERGAGETQACGSGACAIGSLALSSGFVERKSWVGIDMPGGRLFVKHESDEDPVILAGPTQFVFKGTVEI